MKLLLVWGSLRLTPIIVLLMHDKYVIKYEYQGMEKHCLDDVEKCINNEEKETQQKRGNQISQKREYYGCPSYMD